jgi:PPE-repeat protein
VSYGGDDVDFASLPPEINSGRMYAGAGSGPMLAAAAAWDRLANDLRSTAAAYQSAVSAVISGPWLGPSSASMAAAAAPYSAWLSMTATQAAQAASQAKVAVGAYEAAFAMTVPPPVIATNRALLMSLIATNILGQNTPSIAATEAAYMEMWAQDAAAMYGYAGQSAAASVLAPPKPAPTTTTPGGLTGQAAAVAQSTGTSAGTGAQTIASMGSQLLSAVPTALQGLAQPLPSTSALSGILDSLGFTSLQSFLALGNLAVPYTASMATVNLGIGATHYAQTIGGAVGAAAGDVGKGAGAAVLAGAGGPAVSAGVGQGAAVGGLSVPAGWVTAAPEIRTVARALPMTGASVAPAALTGAPGTLFSDMALAGMAGRAMGGTVGSSRPEALAPQRARLLQQAPSDCVTRIVPELEKLAELHNSRVLTDEEFTELKGRLIGRLSRERYERQRY